MNIYRKSLIEVIKNPVKFLIIGLTVALIVSALTHDYWNYLFQPMAAFVGAFFGRLSDNKKLNK